MNEKIYNNKIKTSQEGVLSVLGALKNTVKHVMTVEEGRL